MKEQRGITIVSLVVTIIVLIILAGVSINAILGDDGIITIAKQAKENLELAQIEEQTKLNELYTQIEIEEDSLGDTSYESSSKLIEFKKKIAEAITKSGIETDESATADVMANNIEQLGNSSSSVYYVTLSDGNQLPVPKGFYYVGGTINSGAVISDEISDKEKYKDEEDVPAGVAYNSDGTVNEEASILNGNQFVWIPCTIENYTKVNNFGKTNASGWDKSTNTAEESQIRKYGGFYVGRYEAGTSDIVLQNDVKFENSSTASGWQNGNFVSSKVTSGKITCKAGEIPWYHADYTTAVEMCKGMYNTESVNSGLMTGTMWDVIMKYITTDDSAYSDLKSTSWGNYNTNTVAYTAGNGRYLTVNSTSGAVSKATVADASYHYGIRTTAASEGVKRNNLYDIAGNLYEWTQEAAYSSSGSICCMLRGGSFINSYSDSPVCVRAFSAVSNPDTEHRFPPYTLY